MQVLIGGIYEPVVITRKRVKRITLRIGKRGEIRITCPRWTLLSEIEKMIYQNEAWILDQKLRRSREAEINREGISGDTIWWSSSTTLSGMRLEIMRNPRPSRKATLHVLLPMSMPT